MDEVGCKTMGTETEGALNLVWIQWLKRERLAIPSVGEDVD